MPFKPTIKRLSGAGILLLQAIVVTQTAAGEGHWIFEAAPLQGIWGFPAVRLEAPLNESISAAAFYSSYRSEGQRKEFRDRFQVVRSELVWNRKISGPGTISLAAGAGYERRRLGLHWKPVFSRMAPARDPVNYQEIQNLGSLHQTAGIRFRVSSYWTVALHFTAEENLFKQSLISGAGTIDQPLTPHPSSPTRFQFRLFTGISI